MPAYAYRQDVLDVLAGHGIRPTTQTRPEIVHEFVADLYRYELRPRRLEEDESNAAAIAAQDLAIAPLERGARHHERLAPVDAVGDRGMQRREPGRAIGVGQCLAGADLLDVRLGMTIVALDEGPAELRR